MIAFDTDIIVLLLAGNAAYVERAAGLADQHHAVAIVVAEEILRGRLNAIRQAESGSGRRSLERAYFFLKQSLADLQRLTILTYTPAAELLVEQWRHQKVRVGTHDLRIAAIAVSHGATLVTRNRGDFERIPGLAVEFWD